MPNPEYMLKEEHIVEGAPIWYYGATSMYTWSCPALIREVDVAKRTFKVMSMDDMILQTQSYTFDTNEHSPSSRMSMTPTTIEKVNEYLIGRLKSIEETIKRGENDTANLKVTAAYIKSFITPTEGEKKSRPAETVLEPGFYWVIPIFNVDEDAEHWTQKEQPAHWDGEDWTMLGTENESWNPIRVGEKVAPPADPYPN